MSGRIKHLKTDPACIHYREPRWWWQRRHHDRWRGTSCARCVLSRAGWDRYLGAP